jgi:hypothetical protein
MISRCSLSIIRLNPVFICVEGSFWGRNYKGDFGNQPWPGAIAVYETKQEFPHPF